MKRLRVRAHAKLNLSLEVLGKRSDGFHEILSVMQSVSLADELWLEPSDTLTLECEDPSLRGEDNLVLKAARLLQLETGGWQGARIVLSKRIPAASGMGGASADAAATLIGLDRLWGLHLPLERLLDLSSALGSDVPFFLKGGTALVRGRGEIVEPLPDLPARWFTLLVPPHDIQAKTAALYRGIGSDQWTGGTRTLLMADLLRRGESPGEQLLGNCFEGAAARLFPDFDLHSRALAEASGRVAHMSGAGPTLFCSFESRSDAVAAADVLRQGGHLPLVARTLTSSEAFPAPLPA